MGVRRPSPRGPHSRANYWARKEGPGSGHGMASSTPRPALALWSAGSHMGTRPWLGLRAVAQPCCRLPAGSPEHLWEKALVRTPPDPLSAARLQEPQAGPSWLGLLRWGSVCSGLGSLQPDGKQGASWGQPRAWGPLPASPWLPLRPSLQLCPPPPRPLPGCLPWRLWPQTSSPRPALPAPWPLLSPVFLSVLWCLCVLPSVPQPVCPSVPPCSPFPVGLTPDVLGAPGKKALLLAFSTPSPSPRASTPTQLLSVPGNKQCEVSPPGI